MLNIFTPAENFILPKGNQKEKTKEIKLVFLYIPLLTPLHFGRKKVSALILREQSDSMRRQKIHG